MKSWLKQCARWLGQGPRRRSRTATRKRPYPLTLEALEARWLPSTFTVMDNSDSGSDSMSLRYLLGHVPVGSTIDFAQTVRSITLTSNTDRKSVV